MLNVRPANLDPTKLPLLRPGVLKLSSTAVILGPMRLLDVKN